MAAYCGDNLELHDLGMFNRAFNGGHICRFCTINYKDLRGCDGYVHHRLWDEEIYDEISSALENGEEIENFSLRGKCVLNSLQSFHAATSLAPDLLHDFFEGRYSQLGMQYKSSKHCVYSIPVHSILKIVLCPQVWSATT